MQATKKTLELLPALPPLDSAQRYSIPEAARYLRISIPKVFKDMAAGKLATIKSGKRTFVPGAEIARLSSLPERHVQ